MITKGIIKQGKLILSNRKDFDLFLSKFQDEKEVQIEITDHKRKRTSPQNAYMHQLFKILKIELNKLGNTFTEDKIKTMMKVKFLLYTEVDKETGQYIGEALRHTSELSTTELNEFIEQIKQWASEFDIYLPDPNEQMRVIE